MGTVIQAKPRRHADCTPRWDRTRRAELFDQYRDLQAQGYSPCVKPPRCLTFPAARCKRGGRTKTASMRARRSWHFFKAPQVLPSCIAWC